MQRIHRSKDEDPHIKFNTESNSHKTAPNMGLQMATAHLHRTSRAGGITENISNRHCVSNTNPPDYLEHKPK